MALGQAVLNYLQTADGQRFSVVSAVYFNQQLAEAIAANESGQHVVIGNGYGYLPIPSGLRSVTLNRDHETFINDVLPVAQTYSTPNGFINARIAELQAQITELQGLLQ